MKSEMIGVLWKHIGVIQWVECYIWDVVVAGSNPVTYTINFECLWFFNTNNLVNSKICITFALGNERQGVLNNQNECKFFQRVLWHVGQIYKVNVK